MSLPKLTKSIVFPSFNISINPPFGPHAGLYEESSEISANDAEDVISGDEHYEIICETSEYDSLAEAFEKAGITPDSSELAYLPNNVVPIAEEDIARKIFKLVDALEDLEDVKSVHGNYDIEEPLLQRIMSQ